jgi:hypothetical protein
MLSHDMLSSKEKKQNLPSFLGIGAMRSGTTWLDSILRTHPDIYLPERRKEIHFFDLYYDKGINWYEDFFPHNNTAKKYQQIGEITPAYLYFPEISTRIKRYLPNCRFLVILRNPIDRAYSHYGFWVKNFAEQKTFAELLEQEPEILRKGLYFEQITRYLHHFPQENFLFLLFEDIIINPESAIKQLANFLSVDYEKFDLSKISQKKNSSELARFPRARALACNFRDFLRDRDLDWLWNIAKSSKAEQFFEIKGKPLPLMSQETKTMLLEYYSLDIDNLEKLLKINLSRWKT